MSDNAIIQAAARALLAATDGCTCIADDFIDDDCLFHRVKDVQSTLAHFVVRTVEPLIREQVADAISTLTRSASEEPFNGVWNRAIAAAEEVARP